MNLRRHVLVFFLLLAATCIRAGDDPAVTAVNQLGFSYLGQVKGNSLLSPWSLQCALAMAHAGARGRTAEEMTNTLSYSSDTATMQESFRKLGGAISKSGAEAGSDNIFHSANAIFVGQKFAIKPAWLELTRKSFGAEARNTDFTKPAQAAAEINQWVTGKTGGIIPVILLPDALKPDAMTNLSPVLVLVNAVAFDMPWDELFTKELTKDSVFHGEQGIRTTVPLMFKQHALPYVQKDGFQIATLPYAGGQIQFVIFLPDALDGLAAMEAKLNAALFQECMSLRPHQVRLSLPRMKFEPPALGMKSMLQALGLKLAFSKEAADFSGISPEPPGLYIDEVYHRAVMDMNEDGTKAASATAVVIRPKNGAPKEVPHKVVKADHPFIFAIQQVPSGACLFLGRVTSPPGGTPVASPRMPKK